MGFSDRSFSGSPYQFKSASLRTNENFIRLYDCATELARSAFERSRVSDHVRAPVEALIRRLIVGRDPNFNIGEWGIFQDKIRNVDKLMKRAEDAELSKFLAGSILQCEERIKQFFTLRQLINLIEHRLSFPTYHEERILRADPEILLTDLLDVFAECVSSGLESAHKVVVSALVLLSFVYQYLIGCVDKGGSKTYSPGSFLFRLIFVAIVLFLGSYVWIKSRQVSYSANHRKRSHSDLPHSDLPAGVSRRAVEDANGLVTHYKCGIRPHSDLPAGVSCRAVENANGLVTHHKYVPLLKPFREKVEPDGPSLVLNNLSLGWYDTPREAKIVYHIAAVLYGREKGGPVQFEDGLHLPFPSVTGSEECPPSGKEKADWVTHKTKELYAELLEKARQLQLLHPALETGSHHRGHAGEASRRDPSPSAPGACSTAIESTCFTTPHGVHGLVEQPITSESHGLGQESPPARDLFSAFFPDCNFDQVISNLPQCEENDLPAMDDLDEFLVDYSETDHVSGFESTAVPPQSSALDKPTSTIVASPTQLGGGDQGLGVIEPHLNSATAITFQQLESLPEQAQLQQRVTCEEHRPEEFSESNVELQQKLLECEGRNAELQQKLLKCEKEKSEVEQKLRKSEVENEKHRQWRFMFRQLAKLMLVSDEDGNPVDIQ